MSVILHFSRGFGCANLHNACGSSLLGSLGRTRAIHAREQALLADGDVDRPPVGAVASSRAAANVAEVSRAVRASHVVAADSALHSGLTSGAHLVVNAPDQANKLLLCLLRPPRRLGVLTVPVRADVVHRHLVYLFCALHAVTLEAGATAVEAEHIASPVVDESADEHPHLAVAVQTVLNGSCPLCLLHVEAVFVLLELLLSAEQSRRKHARVERDTADLARVTGGRGKQHVHAVLETWEAILVFSEDIALIGAGNDEVVHASGAGPGGGVFGDAGHCCWCIGWRECRCGMYVFLPGR